MNNEWTFTTKVDASCYNLAKAFALPELDFDISKPELTVKWGIEWEARERGLKGAVIYVLDVYGTLYWEVLGDELTESDKQALVAIGGSEMRDGSLCGQIDVENTIPFRGKKWEYDIDFEFSSDGGCMPSDVEIDFETRKITVQ
jgi:hypothetical protein